MYFIYVYVLLQEDIVDLLDASAGQAIVSKRPVAKASLKQPTSDGSLRGFKMDETTGKLIIADSESIREEKGNTPSK